MCSEVSFAHLVNLSPWVSKLQTSVQSCSEAAQCSLSCLYVCLTVSSLGFELLRGSPLCVFSSTVCVVIYPVPSVLGNWHYLWYRRYQQKPLERGSVKPGRSAGSELIFSLIPGQPHYLDFSNLASISEPILLLCDGISLALGLGPILFFTSRVGDPSSWDAKEHDCLLVSVEFGFHKHGP